MPVGKSIAVSPLNENFESLAFSIDKDLGMITIQNWQEGDCARIEKQVGTGCDCKWVEYKNPGACCGCVCYPECNIFAIIPGNYRLVFSNCEDEHIDDPSWFDNIDIYYERVSSSLDLIQYITQQKGCDMGCCNSGGVSLTDIQALIDAAIAAALAGLNTSDTTNSSVTVTVDDSDDTQLQLVITDSEGGQITTPLTADLVAEILTNDDDALAPLATAICALCGGQSVDGMTVAADPNNPASLVITLTDDGNPVATGTIGAGALSQILLAGTNTRTNFTDAWPDSTTVDIAAPGSRGFSLGEWDKPVSRPATPAEVANANANRMGLTVAAMERLITNRASGGTGMMNENGSLGWFTRQAPDIATAIAGNNGAFVSQQFSTGDVINVPNGNYIGQTFGVRFFSSDPFGEAIVNFTSSPTAAPGDPAWAGPMRDSRHVISTIAGLDGATTNDAIVRDDEVYTWRWNGNNWEVIASSVLNFFQRTILDSDWKENIDGTVQIQQLTDLATTQNAEFVEVTYDIAGDPNFFDPTKIRFWTGGRYNSGVTPANGDPVTDTVAAAHVIDILQNTITPTSTFLAVRNVIDNSDAAPQNTFLYFDNFKPDYAALGGVASF